ncbi:cell division ATP-binding protein FtsE [Robiginitomaculum antarcticum]|uniref:cell division ATP-binding protein FtsE n=1 Tax=Robiginitomaculum antarcticum TaxID=437507 RepID=UPI000524750A|nr:ATP-binding cassette domain-containing protein [Robiginitomaculum antarcticum]
MSSPYANTAPSVQMSGVAMRYGEGPEVLHDIDLTLAQGDFAFLTGPSGAGKSSLLKLMYLREQASRGLISLFGQDTAVLPDANRALIRRRIGVVLQDFALIDHLSVFENVALPLRIHGVRRASYAEDVVEILRWVGLGDRLNSLPPTLSGGEKQRVAIARAVIAKPDLLIADEPTGNVDPEMGARLIRLFAEMNRIGTTVLIATHDLDLIPASARHLIIQDGSLS